MLISVALFQTCLPAGKKDYLGTFSGLVRATFLGERYQFGNNSYVLHPLLLGKYDVLRSITNPASDFERLIKDLPSEFKSVARSELYRKNAGWIERGVESRKFREIELGGKPYIVPTLGKRNVGVDTSGDSDCTYLCIACFDDADCGYAYLEKHLQLPKADQPCEFKWTKLNSDYRKTVVENLRVLVELSGSAILIIKTNAFIRPEEKMTDAFIKLINGSFSGYERMQGERRAGLRDRFFSLTNETPIHCDSDFSPMSTDKVVRQLVKSLSAGREFTPLHVGLKSEESHPIQVADILCGAAKTLIREGRYSDVGLEQIPFDNKLNGKDKHAKIYCWVR